MNLSQQKARISELYRRQDFEGARAGFQDLIAHLEKTGATGAIEYGEALLGLGSLLKNDLDFPVGAERAWNKIASQLATVDEVLGLDEDFFDVFTQALLLLGLVQIELGKPKDAEKNLKFLREIAIETRGAQSADVAEIDRHLQALRKQ